MTFSMEELAMMQQYIFHGYIIDMLDLEREKLKHMKGMLRSIAEEINEAIFDRVHQVMIDLRKEFKAREIKIVDRGQREGVMWYELWCRGYTHNHGIWRDHAKSEIARILGKYSGDVEKKLRAAR